MTDDARLEWPAAARNREPIHERLAPILAGGGRLLEIASGTGEHCVYFAARSPKVLFQPSDPDQDHRASIDAWASHTALENVSPALDLDVTHGSWWDAVGQPRVAWIYCANMVHISPWSATLGLFEGAGQLLDTGARLVLYGPYLRTEVETAPSNVAFDESLRARNREWGLRPLEEVEALGERHGLFRTEAHEMPANNLLLVFQKN